MGIHATHPAIIKRLKRAKGHLGSIVTMLEEERPCLDIAQQMHAVEKAITSAKETLVRAHLGHCLKHAVGRKTKQTSATLEEFKEITKYL